jgi:hypothetical protein
MKLSEIRDRAKSLNIDLKGRDKTALIRLIQKAEGNFPCFATAKDYCDQFKCCWRDDCLPRTRQK